MKATFKGNSNKYAGWLMIWGFEYKKIANGEYTSIDYSNPNGEQLADICPQSIIDAVQNNQAIKSWVKNRVWYRIPFNLLRYINIPATLVGTPTSIATTTDILAARTSKRIAEINGQFFLLKPLDRNFSSKEEAIRYAETTLKSSVYEEV